MTDWPINILLIEDDELFRLGLSTRLQQGATLHVAAEAEDGETAIALVSQQPFDVVLLDKSSKICLTPRWTITPCCISVSQNG